jgi:hypothetical protein
MTGKAEFPKFKLELKKHKIVLPSKSEASPLSPGIPRGDDDDQVPLIDVIIIQGNICDLDIAAIGKVPPKTLRASPSRSSFFQPSAASTARHLKLPEIHNLTSDKGYILFMHKMNEFEKSQPFIVDITKFLASFAENKNVEAQAASLTSFFDKISKNLKLIYTDEIDLVLMGFHSYVLSDLYKQYDLTCLIILVYLPAWLSLQRSKLLISSIASLASRSVTSHSQT